MTEIASRAQLRLSFLRWAVVTVPLVLFLGFLSGRLVPSGSENEWYAALAKPSMTPPGWMFPVAWTILYVLEGVALARSEEHTSELQSLMRISYAVFCLKKKKRT